jgi:hypothetical protein
MTYHQGYPILTQFAISTPAINPSIPAIEIPAERFNPTILKLSQEDAMEQIALLRDHNFFTHGSAEMHSGIHPVHGKCIIQIFDAYATIIPFA